LANNLPLREKLNLAATKFDRADRDTFSHQGETEVRPIIQQPRELAGLGKLLRLRLQVGDLDGALVQHRSAVDCAADQWEGEPADGLMRDRVVVGDEAELVAVHAEDRRVDCLAKAGSALRYGIEHRLEVARRARDYVEDLAGRGLLLT
jgi:hypothetical protein